MDQRLTKIEDKLDALHADVNVVLRDNAERLAKLETNQRGMIAVCTMLVTAAFAALARMLHL